MPSGSQLDMIDNCLTGLGKDDFSEAFFVLVQQTGAVQINIYSCNSEKPCCLLSRNFDQNPVGELTTTIYFSGWYLKDPLLKQVKTMLPGAMSVHRLKKIADSFPEDYRKAFDEICIRHNRLTGLVDKLSVLLVGSHLRLIVNLYYNQIDNLPDTSDALLSIIGHLALQHYEARPETSEIYPAVLESLSEREREVCQGILSGKKAERIASDMDVAPSTVVTYRKRAYEKLGISSRSSLFEICGG